MGYLDEVQTVRSTLFDIARHTNGLAVGLQQAAPPTSAISPSVQYLSDTTLQLQEKLGKVNQLIEELNL